MKHSHTSSLLITLYVLALLFPLLLEVLARLSSHSKNFDTLAIILIPSGFLLYTTLHSSSAAKQLSFFILLFSIHFLLLLLVLFTPFFVARTLLLPVLALEIGYLSFSIHRLWRNSGRRIP